MSSDEAIPYPLLAPAQPLVARRHGPRGYRDYRAFKRWLRDEHGYRCVYCLTREMWLREYADFGVDHIAPQSVRPDLATAYENPAYACNNCNRRKVAMIFEPDLSQDPLAAHLRFRSDGDAEPLSETGALLIDQLHLNLTQHVELRRLILQFWEQLLAGDGLQGFKRTRLARLFEYPADLDDLRRRQPPGGNIRPEGVDQSAFVLRERGLLPRFIRS